MKRPRRSGDSERSENSPEARCSRRKIGRRRWSRVGKGGWWRVDLSGKEASKMLHEQWKALDVEAKIEYENRAHEENVRRLGEMESCQNQNQSQSQSQSLGQCHVCDKQNDKETKELFR